jgi:hypothetical protein
VNLRPPGTFAVLRLLAQASVRRLLRAMRIARSRRTRGQGGRSATSRKSGAGLVVLMLAMLPLFLFQALMISGSTVHHLVDAVQGVAGGAANAVARDDLSILFVEPVTWTGAAAAHTFAGAGTIMLLTLLVILLAGAFGSANVGLAGGEWSFSWLLTFPVSTRSLVLAKALEYSLVQLLPWFLLFPLLLQLLSAGGSGSPIWLAAAATLATSILTGSLRLWIETWLRLRVSLLRLRSVQGACSIIVLLLMAGLFRICLGEQVPAWFIAGAAAVPDWLRCLPAAWPLALLEGHRIAVLTGVLATVAGLLLSCHGTVRLLAHGAMRTGGVDPGKRGAAGQAGGQWAAGQKLHGVLGKDLRLLVRDRNFLVQTVVVPLFVIALQLMVNPGLGRVGSSGAVLVAYGIGVYSLIGGCFQVLSSEGRALWILYTLPVQIAEVLRKKTRLWASLAVGFALTALVVFALRGNGTTPLHLLVDAVCVGAGVFCAAHLAAAISILGTNPAADHVPRQPKPRYVYLYFFLAGTYFVGLRAEDLPARGAALLVFATLAFGVWQRACDRIPWLLDPIDEGKREISLFDASVAVTLFFLVQVIALAVQLAGVTDHQPDLLPVLTAFVIAGGFTIVVLGIIMAMRGVAPAVALRLNADSAGHAVRSLLLGVVAGAAAGGLAVAYLHAGRSAGWLPPAPPLLDGQLLTLLLLAVVAAPLFEETIFRGLAYQGLARMVSQPVAVVWSACLFAVMHPLASWPPVFVLGVTAALVLMRTRYLPAAMAAHASYNLIAVLVTSTGP